MSAPYQMKLPSEEEKRKPNAKASALNNYIADEEPIVEAPPTFFDSFDDTTTTTPTTTPTTKFSAGRQAQYDSLHENYLTDKKALEEQRSLARQEANINHELLMKYLPILNKQNGLHGLGVAQSANIEALANYQNNLTEIDRNYNASMAELDKGFNSSMLSLYDQQAAEDRENSLAAYNEAYDLIVAGVESKTKDEIANYIDGLDLDDATKAKLGNLANYLYGDETAEQSNGYANATVGEDGSVTVQVGKDNVTLLLGEAVSLPANVAKNKAEGEAFAYNNGIFVKKNGVVYQLIDENGGMTSAAYSKAWDRLTNGMPVAEMTGEIKQNAPYTESTREAIKPEEVSFFVDGESNKGSITLADGTEASLLEQNFLVPPNVSEGEVFEQGEKGNKQKYVKLNGKYYMVNFSKAYKAQYTTGTRINPTTGRPYR